MTRIDPIPLITPRRDSAIVVLTAEAGLVRTALRWFDAMTSGAGDLDRVTLEFVYGPRAGTAVLDLMDACHDVEHHRRSA